MKAPPLAYAVLLSEEKDPAKSRTATAIKMIDLKMFLFFIATLY
jgi:hypothetical protein